MKKIFKAFAVIASLAILGGAFMACSNDNDDDDEPAKYTITYQTAQAAASKPDSKTVTDGYKLTESDLPTLSADGYAFGGWHNGSESGATVSAGFEVKKDLTLVAGWTEIPANSVVVTFNANTPEGATLSGAMAQQTVTKETETALTANAFAVEGYRFVGWNSAADGSGTPYEDRKAVTLTANLELYAQWKAVFTVTFNVKGGAGEIAAQEIESGAKVSEPETAPTRAHYTFGGWFTSSDNGATLSETAYNFDSAVTASITLYAKWTEITHTVTLNIGTPDGTAETVKFADNATTTKAVGEETGWTLPSFTELGIAEVWSDHVPFGWSAAKQDVSADASHEIGGDKVTVKPTEDMTIYVVWKEGSVVYYTVEYKYENKDGNFTEDTSLKQENLTATLNEETNIEPSADSKKENYTVPENQKKTFEQKTGNTVTFQYALVTHSVTFTSGDSTESTQSIKHGAKATKPATAPTKDGFVFDGWYNGNDAFDFDTAIEADVTLTAHFTEITLNITGDAEIAATADTLTLSETHAPTGDGYTVEWSVPANSCVEVNNGTLTRTADGITADATVTVTATLKNGDETRKTAEKTVTVKANKFTITHATSISNGSITAPTANSTAKVGETVTITLSPSDGYTSNKPTVRGVDADSVTGSENEYTFTMPAQDVEIGATFSAGSVEYTVKHLFQKVSGGTGNDDYEANNSYADETKSGTVGAQTEAEAKTVEGFEAQTITQTTIEASGTEVIVKYNRKNITITLSADGGTGGTESLSGLYGATVGTATAPTKKDYAFTSWSPELPTTFPASDATYTAQYEAITLTVKADETEISEDGYTWSAPEGEGEDTLTLTAKTIEGATVAWSVKTSDDGESELVQINNGVLSFKDGQSRPTDADVTVKVTATATKGNGSTSKEISIVIKKTEATAGGEDNNQSDNSEDDDNQNGDNNDENENDSGAGGENTEGDESNNEGGSGNSD